MFSGSDVSIGSVFVCVVSIFLEVLWNFLRNVAPIITAEAIAPPMNINELSSGSDVDDDVGVPRI